MPSLTHPAPAVYWRSMSDDVVMKTKKCVHKLQKITIIIETQILPSYCTNLCGMGYDCWHHHFLPLGPAFLACDVLQFVLK